jgi:DNA-binding transcriptional MerR regulator
MSLAAYAIPEKIFFKIGEVCDLVGVQPHVLRYWETEFPMLSPQKNRRRDVEIALRIKELLYEDLYTIAGAKKKLSSELREQTKLKVVSNNEPPKIEQRTAEPEFHAAPPAPVYAPPSTVRNFPTQNFEEHDEDFDADFEMDDFDVQEVSPEQKTALHNLRNQLTELLQILERPEDAPRRAW